MMFFDNNILPLRILRAAVSNAVNGAYYSLTANFETSGISTEGLTGFEISSTSEVFISEVFLTNFKDKEAVTEYPKVDAANASMFDNFNRTQSGFDGDYDASSTNQTVLDAGLNYALSYNNGDKVSVANGYVTFDATNLAAGDYINFKEGNDDAYHGEKYLVLSVVAIFWATTKGSTKSIIILPGDDAKFAPADIIAS